MSDRWVYKAASVSRDVLKLMWCWDVQTEEEEEEEGLNCCQMADTHKHKVQQAQRGSGSFLLFPIRDKPAETRLQWKEPNVLSVGKSHIINWSQGKTNPITGTFLDLVCITVSALTQLSSLRNALLWFSKRHRREKTDRKKTCGSDPFTGWTCMKGNNRV